MLLHKIFLVVVFSLCMFNFSKAQTMQQVEKEYMRKNERPFIHNQPKKILEAFKLKGYTDSTILLYTKSAICKMDCLKINESQIRGILKNGLVNEEKSELDSAEKKFAVEAFITGSKYRVTVHPRNVELLVTSLYNITEKTECNCGKSNAGNKD